jgi:hypothetical protein
MWLNIVEPSTLYASLSPERVADTVPISPVDHIPHWFPQCNQRDRARGILSGLTFKVHRPIGTPVETVVVGA